MVGSAHVSAATSETWGEVLEGFGVLSPPKKNKFPDSQQQQAISIYVFLE